MPEQRAAEPAAQRDAVREAEIEQRRGVIDLPARHDHQDHGDRVDPMHDPDPGRLNHFGGLDRGVMIRGCKAGHGCSVHKLVSGYGDYTPGTRFPLLPGGYEVDAGGLSPSRKSEPGLPGSPTRLPSGNVGNQDARYPLRTPAAARYRPRG